MKKRDIFWLKQLLYFLIIIMIFAGISIFSIIHFNSSYMNEEQEELQIFKRQIIWVVEPYLKDKNFVKLRQYADDFKDEDIAFRIFDADKNLIIASKPENTSALLSPDSNILRHRDGKWKLYKHSMKTKMIGLIEEFENGNEKYYLELTISEDDVIKSIVVIQRNLIIFFFLCVSLLILGLADFLYKIRKSFNKLEDSVIEVANGNLEASIDIPKINILIELAQSTRKMVQRLKRQIERLTRLEEYKSIFLQDITHEIKTPITAISSAIQLLEIKNSIPEEDRECFNIIQFQINAINKLVNDILCLSEIEVAKTDETNHFKKFSLNATIKEELENFSHFEQKINFIQHSEVTINGNEELFLTAVSNLLTNAIKYSGSDKIDIILSSLDKQAKLEIKDYGIGISEEHLPHIFERFYRVDKARSRQKGGTGLGLAIVKNIVELHGGTITVKSETGKGTAFLITLQAEE